MAYQMALNVIAIPVSNITEAVSYFWQCWDKTKTVVNYSAMCNPK